MRRMLIVDDEHDICECLGDFFSSRGFAVRCTFSGEQALEQILNGETADVIILDIMLPGISGLEVLKRVKECCPEATVMMITALTEPGIRQEAEAHGAVGLVTKPFDFSERTWSPILRAA